MSSEKNGFGERPKTLTRLSDLKEGRQVIVVTKAFGAKGEDLMCDHLFSGERGIMLRVRQGDKEADVILSPFLGDPSKVSDVEFDQGVRCELFAPGSGEPLDKIPGLTTEDGGAYYAVYLSSKLADGELVAVNDVWGNPNSRLLDEGDLLALLAESEGE
jgi:hypothetical protein